MQTSPRKPNGRYLLSRNLRSAGAISERDVPYAYGSHQYLSYRRVYSLAEVQYPALKKCRSISYMSFARGIS
jgi:hypothetical protein